MGASREPTEEDVRKERAKVKRIFKTACKEDGDLGACHKLAEFYESIEKKFEKSARLYEQGCRAGMGHSCMNLGVLHYLGAIGPADKARGTLLFEDGCAKGYNDSCQKAAIGNSRLIAKGPASAPLTPGEQDAAANAFKWLETGCANNGPMCCFAASTAYMVGYGRHALQDLAKANAYAAKACEMGVANGCINAARMFMRGDGVPADAERARYYKKKAQEAHP